MADRDLFTRLFRDQTEETESFGYLAALINHRFTRMEDLLTTTRDQFDADLTQVVTTVQSLGDQVTTLGTTITDALARAAASGDFSAEEAVLTQAASVLASVGTQLSQVTASTAAADQPAPAPAVAPATDPAVTPDPAAPADPAPTA